MNEEKTGLWLRQTEHICGLWLQFMLDVCAIFWTDLSVSSWYTFLFFEQQYIFIQNACFILTSKAQATYEVFHMNIFLYN